MVNRKVKYKFIILCLCFCSVLFNCCQISYAACDVAIGYPISVINCSGTSETCGNSRCGWFGTLYCKDGDKCPCTYPHCLQTGGGGPWACGYTYSCRWETDECVCTNDDEQILTSDMRCVCVTP